MTKQVKIYHNPRCSKSRETLSLLKENGVEPEVVLYLETPADAATLRDLLKMLGMNSARELMRQKEDLYKELNLADSSLSEGALIQAMVDNPKLMERPIVVANGKARIGRPPELVLEMPEAEDKRVAASTYDEELSRLSEKEQETVKQFSKQIDVTQTSVIMRYGAKAQEKVAAFSEDTLEKVRTKDLGDAGKAITNLIVELKGFDIDQEEKGLMKFFKKQGNKLTAIKSAYDKAEVNIDKICSVLERHQMQLLKDIHTMDELYHLNEEYYKELTMYILAGKISLEEAKNNIYPQMKAEAEHTRDAQDAQKVNDYASFIARFEKRLHDLELTRMVALQSAPQIRMIQNNDLLMSEKIESTLNNTIPLWKSQMVLALGAEHTKQAMEAQRSVTDMTNELLEKNAEALKMSTIETAKESERGIVDLETLQKTNQSLIDTLDEVSRIQDEGREKRAAAEVELVKLEQDLKNRLLLAKGS